MKSSADSPVQVLPVDGKKTLATFIRVPWLIYRDDPAWIPERWFDVFEEASGRFLGRVDVPEGFAAEPEPVIDGDRFICLTRNELDLPVVRRYRLEVPA